MSTAITGISSMATRPILGDLARQYEEMTGFRVAIKPMGGVDAARLVRAGEATDIIVLASNVMAELEAEGHIVSGSTVDFARSGMAIAVRAGAERPDISDGDSVRRAISAAGKVCYSTGPSGDHLLQLCERWGLLPMLAERMIKAPPGLPVGALVAEGKADLGFQQLSELLHVPGVEIVGPLPSDIQAITVFSAGVCGASVRPKDTRDLIAYLTSSEADSAKREYGMEPAAEV